MGWSSGDIRLASIIPGAVPMQPMAAACFAMMSFALLGLSIKNKILTRATSVVVLFICAWTAVEYLTHLTLMLDNAIFWNEVKNQPGGYQYPGRMAPASTLAFATLSIAVISLSFAKIRLLGHTLVLITGAFALVSILGYLFGVSAFKAIISNAHIALPTASCLFILVASITLTAPYSPWATLLLSSNFGGAVARRFLPLTVVPIVVCWLSQQGALHALYPLAFSWVIVSFGSITLTAGLMLWAAARLRSMALNYAAEQDSLIGKLRAAEADALNATTVKSAFLANMSHELRTPLTSIIGYSELLRPHVADDERGSYYLSRTLAASENLLAIVSEVLDFSKLEAGQVEISLRPFDPRALFAAATEMLAPQAASKGLVLDFMPSGDLPGVAWLDDTRVRQILVNFVSNAVKFTETGSVTVVVSHADGILRCEVCDTGQGIPADRKDRLFQRFSQVDASTTRNHGGTGLGLAICKGHAEAMGGSVGVVSAPGHGSTFWFEVPCIEVEKRCGTNF